MEDPAPNEVQVAALREGFKLLRRFDLSEPGVVFGSKLRRRRSVVDKWLKSDAGELFVEE